MMTERERVLSVLRGTPPDRVPWLGDLAYWIPYALKSGIIDSSYAGDGLYRLHRDLGLGFYLQGYFPFEGEAENVDVVRTVTGATITTQWKTPVGTLRQVETELPASYTVATREHMIKNINDLKTYVYIEEHTTYRQNYGLAARRRDLVGDNGAVLCYLPKSPYMELVALRAGIMSVVDMLGDDPDEFEECLDRLEVCADRAARLAVNSPAEFLMIPENISSEVVGKRPYHKYMERYQKKWFRAIKEAGKVSFVHMDGTMRGLLREVSEAGAAVMEALTPAPTGDIEVEDLHNWALAETILWGGIPGAYFTDHVSDAKFDEYVKRVLDTWTTTPRYVLGVADQVPPYSRPERIMRVRTLVDRYGAY
jgi:hypothetical protein